MTLNRRGGCFRIAVARCKFNARSGTVIAVALTS